MLIRVEDILEEGLQIEEEELSGVLVAEERAWVLGPVSVLLRREDRDVVLSGTFQARVELICGRCLESFTLSLQDHVAGRFSPRPAVWREEVGLSGDDLDVAFYDGESVDLGAFLLAEALLGLPMKPLCRENCLGLCRSCGVNRNLTTCGCEPEAGDPRFAPLRALAQGFNSRGT